MPEDPEAPPKPAANVAPSDPVQSEADQKRVALAVRGTLKLPTGDKDAGVSTGKTDGFLDFIVSKDVRSKVEVSGYGGAAFRAKTSDVTSSTGFRTSTCR